MARAGRSVGLGRNVDNAGATPREGSSPGHDLVDPRGLVKVSRRIVQLQAARSRRRRPAPERQLMRSRFRCPACGAEFETYEQLDEHGRATHPS